MSTSEQRPWSLEELRVLVAIFFNASFSIGDDNRLECQAIADALGRTPGSVDRQWRNVASVAQGRPAGHIGRLVAKAVRDYLAHPGPSRRLAVSLCQERSWPIEELVATGRLDLVAPASVEDDDERHQLIRALRVFSTGLRYKMFSSGSQGFFRQGKLTLKGGARFQSQVTAVLIGSKGNPHLSPLASGDDLAFALRPLIESTQPKVFRTGRSGYYATGKVPVALERYQVSLQAVQLTMRQEGHD